MEEENYQEDSQQKSYIVGQIKGMIKNIGIGWKGIGGDRRENGEEAEEN